MKKFGNINNISEELLATVPKLGPKDSAEYRLLGIVPDEENKGQWKIPFMKSVKSRFEIIDPYTDTIETLAYLTGTRTRPTKDGHIELADIQPLVFLRKDAGRIIVHGNKPEDRLKHEFLFLSPQNIASPLASDEVTPIYEYVDVKATARKNTSDRKRRMEALSMINDMQPKDGLFDYAFMITRADITDVDVAKDRLAAFAEADTERFFDMIESVDSHVKVIYLRAMSTGVISYDATSGAIKWARTQELITAIPKNVVRREDAFALWAKASAENMKLVDTIAAMVNKRQDILPEVEVDDEPQEDEEQVVETRNVAPPAYTQRKQKPGRPPKKEKL